MTTKEKERELTILKTADALKEGMRSEFWEYLSGYFSVRIASLKNELAKIDLSKELSKAAKIQGKIEAFHSIFSRMKNVIAEAENIKKKEIKKKEKVK